MYPNQGFRHTIAFSGPRLCTLAHRWSPVRYWIEQSEMHPHLTGNKVEACGPIIEALHECHQRGFWTYYTGGCNDIRRQLDKCLHAERMKRSSDHVREGKQKRKELEEVWRENRSP